MLTKKKFRRNTIVRNTDPNQVFFGRIIRSLPNDEYLWLCSGLHFYISKAENLVAEDYKGYIKYSAQWDRSGHKRFIPMTNLRNLKRQAKRYHGKNAFNTPLDYKCIQRS